MLKLTHSSAQCYRNCPRRYRYEYVDLRVKITEGAALTFGRAWHLALACYWLTDGAAEDRRNAAVRAVMDQKLEPQTAAQLSAMLSSYAPPVTEYAVESVEQLFEIAIVNPETGRPMKDALLCGRTDLILRRLIDDARTVGEHKSTSEDVIGFGPYWQWRSIDSQISSYAIAAGATGALYDVAKKPTLKFCAKDGGDYGAYTQRCIEQRSDPMAWHQYRYIVLDAQQHRECAVDLWQLAHQIRDCTRLGTWPRNSGACRGFYGMCPFLDVCTGAAWLNDDTIFRSKEGEHEELLAA
jgi:hypothetical protein